MALKVRATSGGGGDTTVLDEGSYPAVLVAVIDLGVQRSVFNNEEKWLPQVYLAWELTGEPKPGKQGNYVLGRHFTLSLNPKAKLREFLEKMAGKIDESKPFDFKALLGKACQVQIAHDVKGDRTYMRLEGVAKVAKGQTVPDATVEPCYFELPEDGSSYDWYAPDWLPFHFGRNLTEVVSDGYLASKDDKPRQSRPVQSGAQPVKGGGHKVDPNSDECPF